ncbi:hypothetical protein [Methanogenium organophilum]|uniref:4Fe-4S ferredoxin-type domain-containing protein n=1 Tax=Methanogenium organophilum TaxID=2199 RepID=A0A9X9S595_METOG|nr:hypothetical protein [Methanogenium organophilum]WAI01710.1 hypothetical protein OU421_02225 [Methanogenium organophilum]
MIREGGAEGDPDQWIMNAVLAKALTLGASVAGYVPVSLLADCPSVRSAGPQGLARNSGTVIVLGLYHDPACPEMDWWEEGRSTPGDRILYGITTALSRWLGDEHGRVAHDIPYDVTEGGIYLKDAAVLAGLGVFGKNNLVIVPGFGSRIRFRALWADLEVGIKCVPECLSPCTGCSRPCQTHCPQDAFPGGRFSRKRCLSRMDADKAAVRSENSDTTEKKSVQHCRNCELLCVYAG